MSLKGVALLIRGFVLPSLGLLLVVGCTEEAAPEPELVVQASIPAAETEVNVTPEEEALEVYSRFWDAIVQASTEMDPDAPELEQYATGRALAVARLGLEGVRDAGIGMEGELNSAPEIVVVTREHDGQPVEVEIKDCQAGGDWRTIGADEPELDNVLVTAIVRHDLFDWWVVEMRIWGGDSC